MTSTCDLCHSATITLTSPQDRERPDTVDRDVRGVKFEARFARDVPEYRTSFDSKPGVDGFVWLVDALYQVGSGHQWFLQVC